jgi:hypothetical protein
LPREPRFVVARRGTRALLAVVLFAASGCGDSAASPESFRAEIASICEDTNQQIAAVPYPPDGDERAIILEKAAIYRQGTEEMDRVEPPEEFAPQVDEFIAAREEVAAAGEEYADVVNGDPAKLPEFDAYLDAKSAASSAGNDLGLPEACTFGAEDLYPA